MIKINLEFTEEDLFQNQELRRFLETLAGEGSLAKPLPTRQAIKKPIDAQYIAQCEIWEGTDIDELGLNQRCARILESSCITTLGQLVKCSEEDLLRVKGLSAESVDAIKARLSRLGLSLQKA